MTERKTTEEALRLARDQALETSTLKGKIAANLSHEVRTPLAGILGMAELLKADSMLNADQRQTAEYIYSSGQRLLSVVNDLLDFSKLEAGRVGLVNADFQVDETIKEIVTLMTPVAAARNVELTWSIDSGVPKSLKGDAGKIQQCVLNFVHNALKFTGAGGRISISVQKDEQDTVANFYRFTVTDSGIGIDLKTQNRLFQPFVQADESISASHGGTGLGLSIVKGNVELMNGRVGLVSTPGNGSSFWFAVPLMVASVAPGA